VSIKIPIVGAMLDKNNAIHPIMAPQITTSRQPNLLISDPTIGPFKEEKFLKKLKN